MATPPFLPDETLPGSSDLISLYPGVEHTFRDVIETWLLVQHNTTGTHKQVTLDDISTPTIASNLVGLWHESGVLKTRFAAGTVYDVLTTNTGMPLAGGTMTGALILAGNPSDALGATTKQQTDLKAALASPALTGNPTAPTQTAGNDSTRLATTAFVQAAGFTRFSTVATTSGTAHGFTGIPAGANRLTFMLKGVSVDGTDELMIQIGDAGGYEITGYVSAAGGSGGSNAGPVDGYIINRGSSAANLWNGVVVLNRYDGDTWILGGGTQQGSAAIDCVGTKTLTAELDRIQILPTGSDDFDAGAVGLFVE